MYHKITGSQFLYKNGWALEITLFPDTPKEVKSIEEYKIGGGNGSTEGHLVANYLLNDISGYIIRKITHKIDNKFYVNAISKY